MTRTKLLALAAIVLCSGGVLVAMLWQSTTPQPAPPPEPQQPADGQRPDAFAAAPVPAVQPATPSTPAPQPEPAPTPPEVDTFPPLVRFGDARLRHLAPVKSLALTADGSHLLTATRDEPVIRLWDTKTAKLVRAVRVEEEFTQSMTVLAITPDARKAFVIRHQSRQRTSASHRWHEPATIDLATGVVTRWPLGGESELLNPIYALSPDGKTLAGISGAEVRVWDFATGAARALGTITDFSSDVGNICFSPDGTQVAVTRGLAAFYVAPVDGSAPLRRIAVKCDKNDVRAVFWPKADRVVALWYHGLATYDPTTGTEHARLTDFGNGNVNLFPPYTAAGGRLFVKEHHDSPITTFDLAALARVPNVAYSGSGRAEPFTVSGDGRVFAVATGHAVRLFDPATGKPLHPELESAPFAPLARLHISPDGAHLLGCTDHTAHAWALSDGRALAKLDSQTTWSMSRFALSTDGKFASGGAAKGAPLVTEVATGREIALPKGDPEKGWNDTVGFAGTDRAWQWNQSADTFTPVEIGTGRAGAAVPGFGGTVFLTVSADGRKLAAAGWGGLAVRDLDGNRGWEVLDEYKERMKQLRCGLSPPPCGVPVRFSPCGRWLLVDDNGLELWDLRKRPVRAAQFEAPGRGEWLWNDGSFAPDGRYVAAAALSKTGANELCVWETASGAEVYRFRPARGVAGCAFTPDGKRLIVAHRDTTLSVWDRAAVEARQLGDVPAGDEWKHLRTREGKQAHAAARALAADPKRALAVLAAQFAPPDAALTNRLIAELGSEEFNEREAAERALSELGLRAESVLRVAVTTSPSPEVRVRAEALLKAFGPSEGRLAGERLRAARAVEVLERIGSADARALLATWAKAYPTSLLATEANAALGRLGKK